MMRRRQAAAAIAFAIIVTLPIGCHSAAAPANVTRIHQQVELAEAPLPTIVPSATPTLPPNPTPTETLYSPTATPVPTPAREAPDERPVAVVVENDPASRPPTGLGAADVIYEAVAEFDLTRFVAVFADSSADVVGPTRSGRDYHVAIAAEYGAAVAHCLGVPSIGQILATTSVTDLDGCRVTNPPGFFRDWSRRMPHNLYVDIAALRAWASGSGTYGPLTRRANWPAPERIVGEIAFVYPTGHPVLWRYEPESGLYGRWQDGDAHVDVAGEQITVSAVLIQFVRVRPTTYFFEAGYHQIELTGEGKATIYANGGRREATWQRQNPASPTSYLDGSGAEILVPPGRVFVQLVAEGTEVQERE